MKKITAFICIFSILVTLLMPGAAAVTSAGTSSALPGAASSDAVTPFDYAFEAPSAGWKNLVAVDAPAKFSNYSYTLADNAVVLGDHNVISHLATAGQLMSHSTIQKLTPNKIIAAGGYLPRAVLDAAASQVGIAVKNGTVFVDEANGTAFKVVSPTTYTGIYAADTDILNSVAPLEDTYIVTKPQLNEVIKEFNLDQTVGLTRGNVTGFAPNIEGSVVNPSNYSLLANNKDFKSLSDNPLIALQFDNVRLDADLGDGASISVNVSGGLGIDNMDLTGRYSGFGGYEIAMTLAQECYLDVTLDAAVKQEIRIPIFGFSVGFGVGSISGGVFAIVGLDGTLRLQIESDTYTSVTQGVHGGTFLYVPTSAKPLFSHDLNVNGDVALSGQIDGYIKFGPMVNLDIFGFDLVGAGVFLGAGVHVGITLHTLDIELHGIFNVYVTIVGKTLNIANYMPTILERHQADTGGYRVKILETFVKPGRMGGTLETEPDDLDNEDGYIPAVNIPYRILVVPQGVSFDPNYPEGADNPAIRKYPSSGYAATNSEGEFIQMDADMLSKNDTAYLQFQANGNTYISDPVQPSLPFDNITLTCADYFNDYVTGQVQPIRVINWAASKNDPPENQYQWVYYDNAIVHVNPRLWDAWVGWSNDGTAICRTDAFGNFDTRLPFSTGGTPIINAIDVRSTLSLYVNEHFAVSLVDHEAVFTRTISNYRPTMNLSYNRVVTPVENSYNQTEQDGKIMNEMVYNEYIWIINPNGTRTVMSDEFDYTAWGFTTVDSLYRLADRYNGDTLYFDTSGPRWSTPPITVVQPDSATLMPVLDENGNETGAALFSQRVTVKWVWQEHPNPVKITSANNTETTTAGGSFQVTATGFAPFAFSLNGAPDGVAVNKSTGLIAIPAGLTENTYTFTIRAEEDRTTQAALFIYAPGAAETIPPDPYQGNDPAPPDEQVFTLTVKASTVSPESSPSIEPSPSAVPSPSIEPTPSAVPSPSTEPSSSPEPVGIAPAINSARHNYQLSMTSGSSSLTVPITAAGSTPITWSLAPVSARQIPKEITINTTTGVLSVSSNVAAGIYVFVIMAENDVGSDTQECRLDVTAPLTAPVIAEETHNYEFSKLIGAGELTVPINATGSTPITWSLEQTNTRYQIPSQVTIDQKTGVLTVKDGIAKGTYYFTIKASNDVGSDTRACTLKVITLVAPSLPSFHLDMPIQSDWKPGITQLSISSGNNGSLPIYTNPTPIDMIPMVGNYADIVCDHALDVYTNERDIVDGTSYIRWDSYIYITVESTTITEIMRDNAPVCDNYHYTDPMNVEDGIKDAVKKELTELTTEYRDTIELPGGNIDTEDLLENLGNFTDDFGFGTDDTYLEFGSLLDQMASHSGGKFEVDLNLDNGTMVPGAYFLGLNNNKGASLTFNQEGLSVTFSGQSVVTSENMEYALYNFAYKAGAFHENDMLAAAGEGGKNFTYGFAYHGQLPGTATFNVTTGIAEGTKVNVYRFDAASGGFTMIAEAMTVGADGIVTYKNNTMSEYLITTKTIAGAQISDMAARQQDSISLWWIAAVVVAAVLIVSGTAWIVLRRYSRVTSKK